MIGQYKGLIPENVAPKGVDTISIYDSNNVKKASMAVPPFMKYPSGEPLYSFGVLADAHLATNTAQWGYSVEDMDYALTYLKNKGVALVCVAGDVTHTGFYNDAGEFTDWQFAKYKEFRDKYASDFPMYLAAGNHESYFNFITDDLEQYEYYVGHGLYLSVMQRNDVFLLVGQPQGHKVLNEEELVWLQGQLTEHADKRCFVFIHPFVGSGNPLGVRANDLFYGSANNTVREPFLTALRNHGNVVLFHGHSHMKLECQNDDKKSNYTDELGFPSVHVPGLCYPRSVAYDENGVPSSVDVHKGAQFYHVEVFEDCIVLNGVDVGIEDGDRTPFLIPQGIIKIDTITE